MRIGSMLAVACAVSGAACPGRSTGPALVVAPATVAAAAMTEAMIEAMTDAVPAVRGDVAPPFGLTASDGSGLGLARVDARAVVQGPLAFTELHLYFHNPEDRTREGTFQITLPAHASVSRFAMADAGQWLEAEVVPRPVARRAYDDFLHRRQDPALLERAAGNQFTAKVFPIAAGSDKHLVISYSQELAGLRYELPLRGLPRAERIDVELAVTGGDGVRRLQRLAERDWQPDRDFVAAAPGAAAAVGAGDLVAAQLALAGADGHDPPRGVALVIDTSASRSLGFAGYLAAVRRLVGGLRAAWGDALPLAVVAFDQDTELVFDGRADGFGEPQIRHLAGRGAAGASDLGQALAWLAAHPGAAKPRVVVVGDGVITAGAEGRELQVAVRRLAAVQVERLDVALAGGLRDEPTAALVARGGLARAGAVLDLERDPVAAALGESVITDVPIAVAGASWVYPRTVASARRGSPVLVLARMAGPVPSSLDVTAGGASVRVPVVPAAAPLVERAVAGAELAELEARRATAAPGEVAALRAEIARRSVAARVLSSETSMLVLERDADYARYGIERAALGDVLVVGTHGVERRHRGDPGPLPARAAPPAPRPSSPPPPGDDAPDLAALHGHGPPPPPPPPLLPPAPAPRATATAPRASDPADDADHDGDGILDADDRCPDQPETHNGFEDDDGCPDRSRVVMTSTAIEVLDNVHFAPGRAGIEPAARPVLDAVAGTLLRNPDIAAVEIQGHSDQQGDAAGNLELSERRAEAVRQSLIGRGVAPERLQARGYGDSAPIDRGHTAAARANNRRVAFVILRRSADGSAAPAPGKPAEPPPAVTGELAAIQALLRARSLDAALARARDWHAREPGDVLALIGLGETLEARGAEVAAARIYGSIIDLYPGRADLRRFAGERLARLASATALAIDSLRRAVADRPDHLTGHRLLAYALVRAGRPAEAFAAILAGLTGTYRSGSHAGGLRVLGDDAGMIGAVYAAAVPARRDEIARALARHHLELATRPSTRFVLYWETDASDVDLHVEDARGEHALFSHPRLASGGELYADVTTGYGPECFAIPGTPVAGPYRLSVDYYARGPMGYGMGMVEIQTFDPAPGPGPGLTFDDRPFVVMTDHARLDLGTDR